MGETRLQYSLFLPLAGLIVCSRWRYKWTLPLSTLLSLVFIYINILRPEIHSKTLISVLQSLWSAPHVIVYMFAYALLGAASVMSVYLLIIKRQEASLDEMDICDNLTHVGWALLTTGIFSGALWAKEAWGRYRVWNPKETQAAATRLAYLAYIHLRLGGKGSSRTALWILAINFTLLQVRQWGTNFLPPAQGVSIHTYNIS